MNIFETQALIAIVDELIFSHSGEHLNDLERSILEGALDHQKYSEIAEINHRSEKYVKDIAGKLWHTLTAVIGEEVNKGNVRSTLQRYYSSYIYYADREKILSMSIDIPAKYFQQYEMILNAHHEALTKLIEKEITIEEVAQALELSLQLLRKQIQDSE